MVPVGGVSVNGGTSMLIIRETWSGARSPYALVAGPTDLDGRPGSDRAGFAIIARPVCPSGSAWHIVDGYGYTGRNTRGRCASMVGLRRTYPAEVSGTQGHVIPVGGRHGVPWGLPQRVIITSTYQ